MRLGTMTDRDRLAKAANTTYRRRGYYGLSLFSRPGMDAHTLAIHAQTVMKAAPGGKMRTTTIGDIEDAGFLVRDYRESDGHFNLAFSGAPDDRTWDDLDQLMTPSAKIQYPEP